MTNRTINGELAEQEGGPGRPSDYRPEYADQARKLCKLGAIDEELADFFEVTVRTIHRWKSKHKEFGKAVRVGKGRADERVKMALYRRAVGYFTKETKVFQFQGVPVYAEVDVEVPPDVRAATTWLVNRQGWRMGNATGGEIDDGPEPTAITVEVVNARLRPPEAD
jgi:hypothetical protein